jgi:hypothetical protein
VVAVPCHQRLLGAQVRVGGRRGVLAGLQQGGEHVAAVGDLAGQRGTRHCGARGELRGGDVDERRQRERAPSVRGPQLRAAGMAARAHAQQASGRGQPVDRAAVVAARRLGHLADQAVQQGRRGEHVGAVPGVTHGEPCAPVALLVDARSAASCVE